MRQVINLQIWTGSRSAVECFDDATLNDTFTAARSIVLAARARQTMTVRLLVEHYRFQRIGLRQFIQISPEVGETIGPMTAYVLDEGVADNAVVACLRPVLTMGSYDVELYPS